MNKLIFLVTFLFLLQMSQAQNLIPNGGFENYSQLPDDIGQYARCNDWGNAGGAGSPDYFHLSGVGIVQLPYCFISTVYPHADSAVMGIACYYESAPDFREYLSCVLLSPLVIGENYRLSFFISNGEEPINYGGMGCDHFSVALSTGELLQSNLVALPIDITPQFTYNGFLYSNSWQEVIFDFVADSAYQHITFGSFVYDAFQDQQQFDVASVNFAAYYFLDDISLTTTMDIDNIAAPNEIEVYPNSFGDFLNVRMNSQELHKIVLYDMASRMVLQESFNGSVRLRTDMLPSGIYIYELRNKYGILTRAKLVKE
jgi:OmpA-OmpF porin, OOP family